MAYQRTLPRVLCQNRVPQCFDDATVEVFDAVESSCGKFCGVHGWLVVSDLQKKERELAAKIPERFGV